VTFGTLRFVILTFAPANTVRISTIHILTVLSSIILKFFQKFIWQGLARLWGDKPAKQTAAGKLLLNGYAEANGPASLRFAVARQLIPII
jgi:hypothetical protein